MLELREGKIARVGGGEVDQGSIDGSHRASFLSVRLFAAHLSTLPVVAAALLARKEVFDAFAAASGDERKAPDAVIVADESPDEGSRFGVEDVDLPIGHPDDNVAVVDGERRYNAVIT
jgi:hypothetical protein